MNKRKLITILIALITLLSLLTLTACGGTLNTGDQQDDTSFDDDKSLPAGSDETGEDTAETPEEPSQAPETSAQTVYIRSLLTGLNVRSGAGSGYTSLGTLDNGDMTLYLGEEGNWYRTYYKGKTAYVSSLYSQKYAMEAASEEIEGILMLGEKLLGTPYVYGAQRLHYGDGVINSKFDISKFDCSSYTQYMLYYGAEILLGTTTRTQVTQGVHIDKEDIKRGDLLFFTNSSRYYNTGIERVGHVAVYLGDNYILHTASDHAVIEKISATRWGYYMEARRFISPYGEIFARRMARISLPLRGYFIIAWR